MSDSSRDLTGFAASIISSSLAVAVACAFCTLRLIKIRPLACMKRQLMHQDLEAIGRPLGEFIFGGNAAEPGQVDNEIRIVKQLQIRDKTIPVPDNLGKDVVVTDDSFADDKMKNNALREARRKARQETKPNRQQSSTR